MLTFACLLATSQAIPADNVDRYIESQMHRHHIPGISLAIIDGGQIVKSKCYGFADRERKIPVTSNTLFQCASISKALVAVAALKLVEEGQLTLDGDVNAELKSWQIPNSELTRAAKVTLRELLSHTSGLNLSADPGYSNGQQMATLL